MVLRARSADAARPARGQPRRAWSRIKSTIAATGSSRRSDSSAIQPCASGARSPNCSMITATAASSRPGGMPIRGPFSYGHRATFPSRASGPSPAPHFAGASIAGKRTTMPESATPRAAPPGRARRGTDDGRRRPPGAWRRSCAVTGRRWWLRRPARSVPRRRRAGPPPPGWDLGGAYAGPQPDERASRVVIMARACGQVDRERVVAGHDLDRPAEVRGDAPAPARERFGRLAAAPRVADGARAGPGWCLASTFCHAGGLLRPMKTPARYGGRSSVFPARSNRPHATQVACYPRSATGRGRRCAPEPPPSGCGATATEATGMVGAPTVSRSVAMMTWRLRRRARASSASSSSAISRARSAAASECARDRRCWPMTRQRPGPRRVTTNAHHEIAPGHARGGPDRIPRAALAFRDSPVDR